MANSDTPNGFRVVGALGNYMPKAKRYYIPSTDNTATFVGDLVKLAGSADASGEIPTVAQAAAGDPLVGVIVGIDQGNGVTNANLNLYRTHRPASVAMYVMVVDDPDVILEAQDDGDSDTLTAADMSQNVNFIVGSGNTTTGTSAMEIDTNTTGTSNTLPLRLLSVVPRPDNVLGANVKCRCMINVHQLRSTDISGTMTGGIGV